MTKLYKKIDGRLHYWETWQHDEDHFLVHWGKVGEQGEQGLLKNEQVESSVRYYQRQGYIEFDKMPISTLIIEYLIDGMGSSEDLDKRYELQNRMDQTLGWVGLGHCDGGSSGLGTMDICCLVVDFDIAKKVIEQDLAESPFNNYNRIYLEAVTNNTPQTFFSRFLQVFRKK